jgi:hypothetical protein
MEKELKIIPPDGYEIDQQHSTLDCIKFKEKKQQSFLERITKCNRTDIGLLSSFIGGPMCMDMYNNIPGDFTDNKAETVAKLIYEKWGDK